MDNRLPSTPTATVDLAPDDTSPGIDTARTIDLDNPEQRLHMSELLGLPGVESSYRLSYERGVRGEGLLQESLAPLNMPPSCVRHVCDALLAHATPPSLVALNGKAVLVAELGGGEFSRVCLVFHKGELKVAKILRNRKNAGNLARFRREIRILTTLAGRGVPQIIGSDDTGEEPYYLMEYLPGHSLEQVVAARLPDALPSAAVDELGYVIASAMADVHATGTIHRDLKPANILLQDSGRAKIIDFGLAAEAGAAEAMRLTHDQQVIGSPQYMSPEQILTPLEVDEHADVYSFACILYELYTGRPPYESSSTMDVLAKQKGDALPDFSMIADPVLAQRLRKMFTKRPPHARGTMREHEDFFRRRCALGKRYGKAPIPPEKRVVRLAHAGDAASGEVPIGSRYGKGIEMGLDFVNAYPSKTVIGRQRKWYHNRLLLTLGAAGGLLAATAGTLTVRSAMKGRPGAPVPTVPAKDEEKKVIAPPVPTQRSSVALERQEKGDAVRLYPGTEFEVALPSHTGMPFTFEGSAGRVYNCDAAMLRKVLRLSEKQRLPEDLALGRLAIRFDAADGKTGVLCIVAIAAVPIDGARLCPVYAEHPLLLAAGDIDVRPFGDLYRDAAMKRALPDSMAKAPSVIVGDVPESFPEMYRQWSKDQWQKALSVQITLFRDKIRAQEIRDGKAAGKVGFLQPLPDDCGDRDRAVAVHAVAHAGEGVQAAAGDLLAHQPPVGDRGHGVILAPEDVRRDADAFQDGPEILLGHADEGLLQHRARAFVVMHAHEPVEQSAR
ncbi:MAG: putative serine/threonine protein kinase [Candidatus Peregrinibacteria bacterium Gr01-1014_25]|nr:MAG: putative serine/threonine protein kinase [Candidatus Peregrinibacteria bacterium Gr01-1014_25]